MGAEMNDAITFEGTQRFDDRGADRAALRRIALEALNKEGVELQRHVGDRLRIPRAMRRLHVVEEFARRQRERAGLARPREVRRAEVQERWP